MAKVVKRADLSKKDYRVDAGVLRVKDSVFNIISDIGDGSRADFNEIDPLLYWPAPANPKTGAVAHVLFNDGLGYYSFNGTEWSLNFFYPSSAYVSPGPKVYRALLTQSGTNAPVATVLENTLGTITFGYDDVGSYSINSVSLFTSNKTIISIGNTSNNSVDPAITYTLWASSSFIQLISYNLSTSDWGNFLLLRTPITIEVYP